VSNYIVCAASTAPIVDSAGRGHHLLVSEFDFALPDDLIAQYAAPRGASRLLVLDRRTGQTVHTQVSELSGYLREGDLLVVNNTRVFAARLLGVRVPSGGSVECLLLTRPVPAADGRFACDALMHPGQKLKPGALVRFEGPDGAIMAEVLERKFFGRRTIRLTQESGELDLESLIDRLGHIPLPPYIRRADTADDRERYQTIFAAVTGSVAAPTAGLHFTPAMLDDLDRCGIERAAITLHVGYGTFKPVRAEAVEDHVVDPEPYEIEPEIADRLNRARDDGRRVIAVGTTTTRALEDSARRGDGRVVPGPAEATTFIHPGFRFQVTDGMVTNFHLPRSSLLMLVAALAGLEPVRAAYREAVERR
jgi:S-adenosylmethionine:tRNA ribosyltransferase-isomerase